MEKYMNNIEYFYNRYPEYKKHSFGRRWTDSRGFPRITSICVDYSEELSFIEIIQEFMEKIKQNE